jgi:hypothetical protein
MIDTYVFTNARAKGLAEAAIDESNRGNQRSAHELNIELVKEHARAQVQVRADATIRNLQAQLGTAPTLQ